MSKKEQLTKFYLEARDWLEPLGYQEIYSNNDKTQFHWIKQQIRVVCKFDEINSSYYLLWEDTAEYFPKSILTGKYSIADNKSILEALLKSLKDYIGKRYKYK